MKKLFFICFLSFIATLSVYAQETDSVGVIRIKVDVDSVSLFIDGSPVKLDSYGNILKKNSWFILNVPQGVHKLIFRKEGTDSIEKKVTVVYKEVCSIDIHFPVISSDVSSKNLETAFLELTSDPESVKVTIDGFPDTLVTPASAVVPAGEYVINAFSEGLDMLSQKTDFPADKNISIRFLMSYSQPPRLTVYDIGMEYEQPLPLRNEQEAEIQKRTFLSFTETFAIIPLGQGILARLLLGGDNTSGADLLISIGLGLTAGSYILAHVLPKRKLAKIRAFNKEAKMINAEIQLQNNEIDDILQKKNGRIINEWLAENKGRGIIKVKIEENPD